MATQSTIFLTLTDVDDKIIKAANEAGISTKELSDKFIAALWKILHNLH